MRTPIDAIQEAISAYSLASAANNRTLKGEELRSHVDEENLIEKEREESGYDSFVKCSYPSSATKSPHQEDKGPT